MNKYGLTLTVNSLFPKNYYTRGAGLQWVAHKVLETGKSIEDAVEIVMRYNVRGELWY
jgi:hypothetical protein